MNKLFIIGNITRDPELRTTTDGKTVCTFDVAVNRKRGQQQETDYFHVSAWNALGENCGKYLAKGKKVGVVGRISLRTYTTQQGEFRATLDVTADEVEFLTSSNGYTQVDTEVPGGRNEMPVQRLRTAEENALLPCVRKVRGTR